ncbi:MAG: SDR family NAD(P)-dependent oxidoreductase, partial [Verrucomicrobiaceae bacterium]
MITYDFSGTVTIVTGAASGIGLATAGAVARAGGMVFLNDLPGSSALEAAVASLKAGGQDVYPCPADQSDPDAVTRAVEGVVARTGKINYLVNNAATPGTRAPILPADFARMDEAFWQRLISINQIGPFRWVKAAAP